MLVVVVPKAVHEHLQADAVVAVRAQPGVQAPGGQRALDVVAGAAVRGVFAAVVEFGPGFIAGLGEGLVFAAGGLAVAGDVFGEEVEVGLHVDDAASDEEQVVKVGGVAFKQPQHFGGLFLLEFVVLVFARPHGFHVPGVEVFVREEAEELDVALVVAVVRFGQAVARGHEQGGAAVFEAAVDVVAQMEEEGVARHGGQAAKEEDGFAADGLDVAAQAFVVVVPGLAAEDDVVRHAAGGERQDGEFGGEHQRGVDEVVVVVEPVGAVGAGLRAHDLPAGAVAFERQY